jgi:hypothetical protein
LAPNPKLMKIGSIKLTLLLFVISLNAAAQLKLPTLKTSSDSKNLLKADLQKIVADYPNGFTTYTGEVMAENPQTVEYQSLLTPAGAESSAIVQYASKNKPVYSWQAVMLTTDSYEEAAKKYKAVFNQVKGANVQFNASRSYFLQGTYNEPTDSKRFTNSMLNFSTREQPMAKLKVEVNMVYVFPEWKVNLLVYEREREDDERGNIYDN